MTSDILHNGKKVVDMGINHLRETIAVFEAYQQLPTGLSKDKARLLPFLKVVLAIQEFCEAEFTRTNKKAVVPLELEEAFTKAEIVYHHERT